MNKKKNLTTKEMFVLALQHHKKNNLKIAENLYKEILKTDPNHIDTHNNLGMIFKKLGEPQRAISCYEKVIQIDSNYVDAHNNLGIVFKELGEYQKAISCYEKTIQIDTNYSGADKNIQ